MNTIDEQKKKRYTYRNNNKESLQKFNTDNNKEYKLSNNISKMYNDSLNNDYNEDDLSRKRSIILNDYNETELQNTVENDKIKITSFPSLSKNPFSMRIYQN